MLKLTKITDGTHGVGNCFINGLYLYCMLGFNGKLTVRTRDNSWVPHLLIIQNDCLWHFKQTHNILPPPFSCLFFRGVYEKRDFS